MVRRRRSRRVQQRTTLRTDNLARFKYRFLIIAFLAHGTAEPEVPLVSFKQEIY